MDYPFIKCLEPRSIYNKATGERMLVPCGCCEACAMRKSSINTLRVQLESKQHLYCRFITLTYSDTYIPRMQLIENDDHEYYGTGSDYVLIDPDYGNVLGSWNSYVDYQSLCRKADSYDVPFLRKYDLQKFFKRLRKYFSDAQKKYKIPFGKIRYYACGEYGPVHFRPHYHIILWTSCDEIVSHLGEAVSTCWELGRVSTEIPRGDVSSYVARYVNGSVPLPSIYKLSETRPFSVHSLHLGESFFQATKEEIYSLPIGEVVKRGCMLGTSYSEVSMWRTLKTYYFPRCKEYHVFTSQQRYEAYLIVERLLQRFPRYKEESLASLAEYVLRYIRNEYELYGCIRDKYVQDLVEYIGTDFYIMAIPEAYEQAYRSLYMILRVSSHFCNFVCDGNLSYFNTHKMLDKIETFWKEDELYIMNQAYEAIQDTTEILFEDEEEYKLRFDVSEQAPELLRNTLIYKKFRQERIDKYEQSMKHKKQNDMNKVFERI